MNPCTFVLWRSAVVATMSRWLFVVFWMSAIFALSSIPSLHVPFAHSYDCVLRKLVHIGAYAVLTALLWWAFQRHTGSKVRAWLFAALAAALCGISDRHCTPDQHQSLQRAVPYTSLCPAFARLDIGRDYSAQSPPFVPLGLPRSGMAFSSRHLGSSSMARRRSHRRRWRGTCPRAGE
jgi:hypothetical protein